MLAAVVVWAIYTVGLAWRPSGVDPMLMLAALTVIGLAALAPAYAWEISQAGASACTWVPLASLAYVGIFPGFLGYVFYNRGVAEVGANKASLFIHLMPVFGTLLSAIFSPRFPVVSLCRHRPHLQRHLDDDAESLMGLLDWFRRPARRKLPDDLWRTTVAGCPSSPVSPLPNWRRCAAWSRTFDEKEFTAAGGLELSDAMCASIAVQGCLPILALGLEAYRGWVGIIVYPDEFVIPRIVEDEFGVVHEYDEPASGEAWAGGPSSSPGVTPRWRGRLQRSHPRIRPQARHAQRGGRRRARPAPGLAREGWGRSPVRRLRRFLPPRRRRRRHDDRYLRGRTSCGVLRRGQRILLRRPPWWPPNTRTLRPLPPLLPAGSAHPADPGGQGRQYRRRLIPVGRMAAAGEFQEFGSGTAAAMASIWRMVAYSSSSP